MERAVDLADNDGFMIDIHYQIAEDETYPGAGIRLELYDDDAYASSPMLRVSVWHYEEEVVDQDEGITDVRLQHELDTNHNGVFNEDHEERYCRACYDPNDPDSIVIYDYFAPLLRQNAWYQLVLFVQRNPGDTVYQVRAVQKLEGIQIIPAEILFQDVPAGVLNPTRMRLQRIGEYVNPTCIRLDDITVVKQTL